MSLHLEQQAASHSAVLTDSSFQRRFVTRRIANHWATLVIWAIASAIAIISCSLNRSATRIGEEYVPVGHDAFYHGRRILDAVRDPAAFYEFDSKIHAPEGSLLTWPWGYDYLMAGLVRAGLALGLSDQPAEILLWIPVAALLISVGLLTLVARQLSLSNWPTMLAALCMALAPTTQLLHAAGAIDHHFAEFICVLASLAAGLAWFRRPNAISGIALGAIFGLSLAVHNGLFILQVPFLLCLLANWLQGRSPPRRPTLAFVGALMIAMLLVTVPSLAFRLGRFEFYTLSWFHLYVCAGTAIFALLLAWLRCTRNSMSGLAALAVVLLLPLINEIKIAQSFVAGTLGTLAEIVEVRSPVKMVLQGGSGPSAVTDFYSGLIWLSPVTFLLCLVQCWRERNSPRLLFWISSTCGLVLLSMQLRMHYFGSFALYLPWLALLQSYASTHARDDKRAWLATALVFLLAYVPQIRHGLIKPIAKGGDVWLDRWYPIVPALRRACAEDPGIVLADATAGHYIRYFTECSVIADNFLLTRQHFDKVDEANRLLDLPPDQLRKQAPYVKYILVRPERIIRQPTGDYTFSFFHEQARLATELLFGAPPRPAGYELLDEVNFQFRMRNQTETFPYVRLYKVTSVPEAHVGE